MQLIPHISGQRSIPSILKNGAIDSDTTFQAHCKKEGKSKSRTIQHLETHTLNHCARVNKNKVILIMKTQTQPAIQTVCVLGLEIKKRKED